ncbi:MAG TPA: ROK family protein, partial [Acidimicrobiales bacterium]
SHAGRSQLARAIDFANANPDSPAERVLTDAGAALGRALASLVNIVDIHDVIVLHDGILESTAFERAMREAHDAHLFPSPPPSTLSLEVEELDPTSGARGAAAGALFMLLRSGDVVTDLRAPHQ